MGRCVLWWYVLGIGDNQLIRQLLSWKQCIHRACGRQRRAYCPAKRLGLRSSSKKLTITICTHAILATLIAGVQAELLSPCSPYLGQLSFQKLVFLLCRSGPIEERNEWQSGFAVLDDITDEVDYFFVLLWSSLETTLSECQLFGRNLRGLFFLTHSCIVINVLISKSCILTSHSFNPRLPNYIFKITSLSWAYYCCIV